MFIYEFMSGVNETITGGEEGEYGEVAYDPHLHRRVEKPTSYQDTMIHLLKGSIGAGILAMPDAVYRLGVIYGVIGILSIGCFATYCIHLLIAAQYELCKRRRIGYQNYAKSMIIALEQGPTCLTWMSKFSGPLVSSVMILWQQGLCCVYCVFVAENIKQVCDFHGWEANIRIHLSLIIVPLILINMASDLKLLTPISTVSNLVTIFGLILVFFYLMEDDIDVTPEKLKVKDVIDIPIFIGITLFAMEAVGVVLALEYNMEEPKQFVGLFGLFNIGMAIILFLYTIVGVCGYLKYGKEVKASITLNLPETEKKSQAARLIFAIAIFLTHPLQNFVAYTMVWRSMEKKWIGLKRRLMNYLLRVGLVVIPWLVAMLIPTLGPFISLFGAFCLSCLAIIFPAIIDYCVWYRHQRRFGRFRLASDIVITFVGFVCLISGVFTSVREILQQMGRPETTF